MPATSDSNDLHVPVHPVRFVTSTALFDRHDAAINIMRRILQAQGAEVIHLGHDRSVDEVVSAVVEEDAQGVAVSSYAGGHVEYFEYLADRLRQGGQARQDLRRWQVSDSSGRERAPSPGLGADLLTQGRRTIRRQRVRCPDGRRACPQSPADH